MTTGTEYDASELLYDAALYIEKGWTQGWLARRPMTEQEKRGVAFMLGQNHSYLVPPGLIAFDVQPEDERAEEWCALGAIDRAAYTYIPREMLALDALAIKREAKEALYKMLPWWEKLLNTPFWGTGIEKKIAGWNDAHQQSQEKVIATFRKAAEKLAKKKARAR